MDEQAQFVQWLMEQTKLSQVELAQRLGISASLVSRLVSGERRLTLGMMRHIAEVFGLPQSEVLARVGVLETSTPAEQSVACLLEAPEEMGEAGRLRAQLESLRDPRSALMWSLTGKLPQRTIEKLVRLVELELEFHDNPREG